MDEPPDAPPPAAKRSRRLTLNVSAVLSARGVAILLALVQVAVAVPYLGENLYGAWMLLLAFAGTAHVCDFGIGIGTQHAMAEALARGEADRVRGIMRAGFGYLGWNALAVLGMAAPVLFFADWLRWSGLSAVAAEVRPAALALLALTAVALPLNMAPRLAGAAQMQWLQALWAAAGSAATLGWVALAAWRHLSFTQLVAGAAALAVLQNVAMLIHVAGRLHWLAEKWPALPAGPARSLRRNCALYAVPQFGVALIQGMPAAALSLAGGPVAVAAYNLVQRLLAPFTQAQGLMLGSLWPAYTEAQVRGDDTWVRRKFRQSLGVTAGLLGAMVILTSQAGTLIALWTRDAVSELNPAQAWLACGWLGVLACSQPLTYLLIGLGRRHQLAHASAAGYPVAAAGWLAGALWLGPAGALGLGTLLLGAVLLPMLVVRCRQALVAIPNPAGNLP